MTLKTITCLIMQVTSLQQTSNTQIYLSIKANTFRFLQPILVYAIFFLDLIYFSRQGRQQREFLARECIALQSLTCKEAQVEDKRANCYIRLYYLLHRDVAILLPSHITQQTWSDELMNNCFLI